MCTEMKLLPTRCTLSADAYIMKTRKSECEILYEKLETKKKNEYVNENAKFWLVE